MPGLPTSGGVRMARAEGAAADGGEGDEHDGLPDVHFRLLLFDQCQQDAAELALSSLAPARARSRSGSRGRSARRRARSRRPSRPRSGSPRPRRRPTSSSCCASVRQAQSRSAEVIPPGSGVPVPGANAGSSTSTSTVRNTGPSPTTATVALDHLADPEVAHVVHEEARDPALGLPGELRLAGPVAAQADLHVPRAGRRGPPRRAGTSASRARPRRRRPRCPCRCACRSGRGRPGHGVAATARTSGSAIEWSPPSTIGMAPASTTCATVSSIAACVRGRIGRDHGRVAEVDHPQRRERVDPRLEVRARRAARGADRARAEARARAGRRRGRRSARRRSPRRRPSSSAGSCVYGSAAKVSRPA